MSVTDSLKEKAGPLPVWGWGLIIGGVAAAYIIFTGRFRGSSAQNVDETAAGDVSQQLGDWPYMPANSPGYSGVGDTTQGPGQIVYDSEQDTNFAWKAKGVTYLIQQNRGPLEAEQALSRYLDAEPLSYTQQQMVNQVIAEIGLPPQGTYGMSDLLPKPTEPKPVDAPTPKPTNVPTTTVVSAPSKPDRPTFTVSAKVTAADGSTPMGRVTFRHNTTVLATAPLVNGAAVASVTLNMVRNTERHVNAVYDPASNQWKTSRGTSNPIVRTW